MASRKQIVSRIKNQFRLTSKDTELRDRFILFTAQNIAESYISKRLNDKRMIVTERVNDERTINNVSKNSPSR